MMLNQNGYPDENATPSLISFTTMEFLNLIDYAANGVPPGSGWGHFDYITCRYCHYAWTGIAMFNTRGKECPLCHKIDKDHIWLEHSLYKGEGAMLTPIGTRYSIVTKN